MTTVVNDIKYQQYNNISNVQNIHDIPGFTTSWLWIIKNLPKALSLVI